MLDSELEDFMDGVTISDPDKFTDVYERGEKGKGNWMGGRQ